MILEKPINVIHIMSDNTYKIIGKCINKTKAEVMIMYQEYTTNSDVHYVREINEFSEKFTNKENNLEEILTNL